MRVLLLSSVALVASPLSAQVHASHSSDANQEMEQQMDHCAMGHLPPEQCPRKDDQIEHDGMDHEAMAGSGEVGPTEQSDHSTMDHSQHGTATNKSAPGAASEEAIPARAFEGPHHAADAIWGEESMAPSRKQLARENGGMRTGRVMMERLETHIPVDSSEDGYVWDAQAFYGGDINRFVLKTEGEGGINGELEGAEIQALYSRAIGPFFDLQTGIRFDLEPNTRGHIVIGLQGIAPYMFHVDGALFLSDRGDLTARLEGEYDQRITQRLILQPRLEVELSAQNIPERAIGTGISKIETGVRLRYEFKPEFAPYIGLEYESKIGQTATIARNSGQTTNGLKLLAGLRAWF